MGDERSANPDYTEDVDIMILEYLIYSATKACVNDFITRDTREAINQPSPGVLSQLHILNGQSISLEMERR
jgi:hypothetical protein